MSYHYRFEMITKEDWVKKCSNVKKFEENFIGNQPHIENMMDSIIVNLGVTSDEDSLMSESIDSQDSDSGDDITSGIQRLA